MATLALHFFGTPRIERDGVPLDVVRRKFIALLTYVALGERPHGRAELAALLWPELDEKKALAVLRSTLWEGMQALGEGWLESDRKVVRLRQDAPIWVDVTRFTQLVDLPRSGPASQVPRPLRVARLTEAVSLYRGDFLQGFTLRDSSTFDEWQSLQTEHLRTRMLGALEQLIQLHAEQGQHPQAIACAQRLLALEPTSESTHRHLMRLYAESGQRTRALEQYTVCARILAEQLSVGPQEETRRLLAALRANTPPPPPAPSEGPPPQQAEPTTLPAPTTAFLGRRSERELLAQRLDSSGCRLLTLTGPGGVGKTSLALEVTREYAARHGGGVCFVPLVGVDAPHLLASTIDDALSVPATSSEEPETRLLEHLRSRKLLLVLDNFEHLLPAASLVGDLLAQAPALRVLVTSRERLNLRGEWELALEGLPPSGHEALELFHQAATRADATFQPSPESAPHVARICQRLGGMPLGIELAATWVPHLSLEEIASRVEQDLDFLAGPSDAPERQRSLRTTFLYSWRLMSGDEQEGLRRLSVFRGGFTEESASRVAGASLELLARLMRKHLVRRTPAGRYELHELIRQYAAEQLRAVPEELRRTHEHHADWCAGLLERQRAELEDGEPRVALGTLAPELDNVRAAWSWAVAHHRLEVLGRALDGFCLVHEQQGHHREALEALREALSRLRCAPGNPPLEALRLLEGRLLARLGRLSLAGEALREASELLERSLRLLRDLEAPAELRTALDAAGRLARLQGDQAAARWCFRGSLALSKTLEDRRGVARALGELSAVAMAQGDHGTARPLLEKALALFQELGDGRSVAAGLGHLGRLLALEGDLEGAEQHLREGLRRLEEMGAPSLTAELLGGLVRVLCQRGALDEALCCAEQHLALARTLEHPALLAGALHCLGLVALRRREHAQARRWLEEGLALHRRLHARQGIIESLLALGRLALAQGEPERARGHLHAALEMGMEVGATPQVLEALVGLSELPTSAARSSRVRHALGLILVHPAAERSTRERAGHLLAGEADPLPPRPGAPLPELSVLVSHVLGTPA